MARISASRRREQGNRAWMETMRAERLLNFVSKSVLLLLLVLVVWRVNSYFNDPHSLPIRQVSVEGEVVHTDPQVLHAALEAHIQGGFFSLDLKQIQAALEEIPWVYHASVSRHWPDRLVITVEEQTPIARWGKNALLNRYGEVFAVDNYSQPLPLIEGGDGRETVLIESFLKTDSMLKEVGLGLISLKEDARHDQRLELANGIKLALGRQDQEERLQRFISAYNKTLRGVVDRIDNLDLRYTNGFSVGWKSDGPDSVGS